MIMKIKLLSKHKKQLLFFLLGIYFRAMMSTIQSDVLLLQILLLLPTTIPLVIPNYLKYSSYNNPVQIHIVNLGHP